MGKNELTIEPTDDGSFRLFGYFLGKRFRKRSRDFAKLSKLKDEMESQVAQSRQASPMRSTWLTEAQLRAAESATLHAGSDSLIELVRLGKGILSPQIKVKPWEEGLKGWLSHLEHGLRRFPATMTKNRHRVEAFFRQAGSVNVHEVTAPKIEAWLLRPGVSVRTQLTDGMVLRSFFAYAQKQGWIHATPVLIDLRDMAKRVRPTERPRILTVAQCEALLEASASMFDGKLLPFVVLSTWCFLRKAEVTRTTPADLRLVRGSARIEVNPRKQGTPSYRVVTIPENARKMLARCKLKAGETIYYQRSQFEKVRAAAGLVTIGKRVNARARANIVESVWQENILRHTGISYLYQKSGDIRDVCRQAGNSGDTAFRHYLHLPERGAAGKFYGLV